MAGADGVMLGGGSTAAAFMQVMLLAACFACVPGLVVFACFAASLGCLAACVLDQWMGLLSLVAAIWLVAGCWSCRHCLVLTAAEN